MVIIIRVFMVFPYSISPSRVDIVVTYRFHSNRFFFQIVPLIKHCEKWAEFPELKCKQTLTLHHHDIIDG